MKKIVSIVMSLCFVLMPLLECNATNYRDTISLNLWNHLETMEKEDTVDVALWLEDINQKEITTKTEKKLGYTLSDISCSDAIMSESLLENLEDLSSQCNLQSAQEGMCNDFSNYMQNNKEKLDEERHLTNQYIFTRREIAKREYTNYLNSAVKELAIQKENISFTSGYSPVIIVNVSKEEIIRLSKSESVQKIYSLPQKVIECSYTSAQHASNIDLAKDVGLTGSGVDIGMIDDGYPHDSSIVFYTVSADGTLTASTHATNTINILSKYSSNNEKGVAPSVDVYCTNSHYANVEALLSFTSLINVSLGWAYNDLGYTFIDKWFDHLSSQHSATFVCSAGNELDSPVLSPARAYNTICVGAIDDNNTMAFSDDALQEVSWGSSHLSDIEKPDVLASASLGGSGTSSSAPIVTGSIALLVEIKPSLLLYPQLIKAIVMASCHRKVTSIYSNETMSQGITDRQGSGVFDLYKALSIVGRGQYYVGSFVNEESIRLIQPSYGADGLNISLSWLRENSGSGTNHTQVSVGSYSNLSLGVYLENNVLLKSSNELNSSTEMAYLTSLASNDKYKIIISNLSSTTSSVRYAIAWSMDNQKYRNNDDIEGICLVKNDFCNKYLTNYSNSGIICSYQTNNPQFWVVRSSQSLPNSYLMASGSSTNSYLNIGSTMIDPSSLFVGVGLSSNVYFNQQTNGKRRIYGYDSGFPVNLGLLNQNAIYDYDDLGWNYFSYSDGTQDWFFEKVFYCFGDINMDGTVNNSDVLLLRQYLMNSGTLSSCGLYLADANADGILSMGDVLYIQSAIAGIDGYNL